MSRPGPSAPSPSPAWSTSPPSRVASITRAGIQLGDNKPVINTNTESTKMGTGDLAISKQVKSAIADVTAPTAEFTFDVTLTDVAGKQLAGTYSYEGSSGVRSRTAPARSR